MAEICCCDDGTCDACIESWEQREGRSIVGGLPFSKRWNTEGDSADRESYASSLPSIADIYKD